MRLTSLLLLITTIAFAQENPDWPNFGKYAADNAALPAPTAGTHRIVFMGDSITEGWLATDGTFFTTNGYIDRGISGQTTSQMLLRFRPDVINLGARVVVILAGTNDIAGNTGPITPDAILGNIKSMVELARANGIQVVLCTVLPASDFWWRKGLQPAPKIIAFNEMLRAYAKKEGLILVDYHKALTNAEGGLGPEYADDGVHPNLNGYKVMEPLVQEGIRKALKKKN